MLKAVFTLLAALAFVGGSLVSNEFGGFDPTRFPLPQENPPLQPIGFAFSIWLPIYCWLVVSGVFGLAKRADSKEWQDFRVPLILTTMVGAPWLKVARVSPIWSTVTIWVMLAFALLALYRAPKDDFLWARAPIGLYAGWLTAASAVGSSVNLAGYGVLAAQTSAITLLVLALVMALTFIKLSPWWTPTYGMAVLWALGGVIIKNWDSNQTMVVLPALGCLLIAGAMWAKRTGRSS